VAMTRARDLLYGIRARQRTLYGRQRESLPCPFLAEVHEGTLDRTVRPDLARFTRPRRVPARPEQPPDQLTLFGPPPEPVQKGKGKRGKKR